MVRALIGGLLGGLAMFMTGFIFWGTPLSALALSRTDEQASANLQAAMAQALTPTGTGVYVIPDPATAQGTILYGKGPVAQIFYNEGGFPVMDSGALIGGLILSLIVGVVIALALRFVTTGFADRARATILFALAAVLWLHIGQAVFNHAPWGYILYLAFSDFVALALAGLIAAKLMETKAEATVAAADPGALH
jgi:hypothetical protein